MLRDILYVKESLILLPLILIHHPGIGGSPSDVNVVDTQAADLNHSRKGHTRCNKHSVPVSSARSP